MASNDTSNLNGLIGSVVKNGFCSGCGLCKSIAGPNKIEMRITMEGYLRPSLLNPLSCVEEATFAQVCPGVIVSHPPGTKGHHELWGPLVSVQTGHAVDPEIRYQGSSGGVISALIVYLLSTKKVDFVAQISASRTDPVTNELQITYTREDALRAAGSRYSPSAPLQSLRELLATGSRFAFVGKPCDISALRKYSQINEAVKVQVPYMLSFICAGIPSIDATYKIMDELGVERSEVKHFQYRGDGWPGMTRATLHDGSYRDMDYNRSWGSILNRHLQFRCKICPDGTGEFADIVCADAWYGKNGYPDFSERDGRSLIIARTNHGAALLQEAIQNNAIKTESLEITEIEKMQPYQANRKRMVLGRTIATRLALGSAPRYRRLKLLKASFGAAPSAWLRNAIGSFRRAKTENT